MGKGEFHLRPDPCNNASLYDNQLGGEIPTVLGDLANLQILSLYDNQLGGEIPAVLGDLANLEILSLYDNQLSGEIPGVLGDLANLQILSLSANGLSGEIPTVLGDLANLKFLFLDSNELSGGIPAALGDLANLEILHLNDNQLTGTIPPELENLAQLQVFDIRNTGLCVLPGSDLQTWLATIDFQGSVCGPTPPPPPPPITPPDLLVSTLVSGLSIPWDLAFTPNGTMLFTQRAGVLSSRLTDGTVQTVTADLSDSFARGETGLMGIVVDPSFSSNRRFYTCQGPPGRRCR